MKPFVLQLKIDIHRSNIKIDVRKRQVNFSCQCLRLDTLGLTFTVWVCHIKIKLYINFNVMRNRTGNVNNNSVFLDVKLTVLLYKVCGNIKTMIIIRKKSVWHYCNLLKTNGNRVWDNINIDGIVEPFGDMLTHVSFKVETGFPFN